MMYMPSISKKIPTEDAIILAKAMRDAMVKTTKDFIAHREYLASKQDEFMNLKGITREQIMVLPEKELAELKLEAVQWLKLNP